MLLIPTNLILVFKFTIRDTCLCIWVLSRKKICRHISQFYLEFCYELKFYFSLDLESEIHTKWLVIVICITWFFLSLEATIVTVYKKRYLGYLSREFFNKTSVLKHWGYISYYRDRISSFVLFSLFFYFYVSTHRQWTRDEIFFQNIPNFMARLGRWAELIVF